MYHLRAKVQENKTDFLLDFLCLFCHWKTYLLQTCSRLMHYLQIKSIELYTVLNCVIQLLSFPDYSAKFWSVNPGDVILTLWILRVNTLDSELVSSPLEVWCQCWTTGLSHKCTYTVVQHGPSSQNITRQHILDVFLYFPKTISYAQHPTTKDRK